MLGNRTALAAGAAVIAGVVPFWRCPYRALTGYLCPGCGGTRAARALLAGDWAAAWRYNAFAVLLLALCAMWLVFALVRYARTRRFPEFRPHPAVGYTLLAVAALFTVYRNIRPS